MAIFDFERKDGIQMGTVGDECIYCKTERIKAMRNDEEGTDEYYEPVYLEYKPVYKFWINNIGHCLCMDCFKKTLGDYILVHPNDIGSDIVAVVDEEIKEDIEIKEKQDKSKDKKSSSKKSNNKNEGEK